MACTVIHHIRAGGGSTKTVGAPPSRPARWEVAIWFVLPSGEKHTHTLAADGVTLYDLVPAIGAQIDELIASHGCAVTGAGWTATSHGIRNTKRRRR